MSRSNGCNSVYKKMSVKGEISLEVKTRSTQALMSRVALTVAHCKKDMKNADCCKSKNIIGMMT